MNDKTYIDVQKTQAGRLWSIFISPLFILVMAIIPKTPIWGKIALVIMGILTFITVLYAFVKTQEANK